MTLDLGPNTDYVRIPGTGNFVVHDRDLADGRGELIVWNSQTGESIGLATDVTDFEVSDTLVTFVVDTGSVLSRENGVYWASLPDFVLP